MKILVLLGSRSDLEITKTGVDFFKGAGIAFSLRIASAHRTPEHLQGILQEFEQKGGKVIICVAGKSAHLAGVVAAHTLKPVLAVPVFSQATAGFDALLSMSQMPGGIPVATMGFGTAGFYNATLLAAQILALDDKSISSYLADHRHHQADAVVKDDHEVRIDFPKGL